MKWASGLSYGMHCIRKPKTIKNKSSIKKCTKCNSKMFTMKHSGPHLGLYCAKCGAWLTWVKSSELYHYKLIMENKDKKIYGYSG